MLTISHETVLRFQNTIPWYNLGVFFVFSCILACSNSQSSQFTKTSSALSPSIHYAHGFDVLAFFLMKELLFFWQLSGDFALQYLILDVL